MDWRRKRGIKDTISAREQCAAGEQFGHDAADRPDVHCQQPIIYTPLFQLDSNFVILLDNGSARLKFYL